MNLEFCTFKRFMKMKRTSHFYLAVGDTCPLEKFKIGIIVFSSFSFVAILFPPVQWIYKSNLLDSKFTFLFGDMTYKNSRLVGRINIDQLVLEILLILFISILVQITYKKLLSYIKTKN